MKNYVVGFAKDNSTERVLLIEKKRPEWQQGKLNGIGGSIEDDETPIEAMLREFKEETGMIVCKGNWRLFFILEDANDQWIVWFFVTEADIELSVQQTDEELVKVNIRNLSSNMFTFTVIDNLHWLIPMAFAGSPVVGRGREERSG